MTPDEAPGGSLRITCDVVGGACDLGTIAVLARLKLTADRLGCRLEVSGASERLIALIYFVGLDQILLAPDTEPDQPCSVPTEPFRGPRP